MPCVISVRFEGDCLTSASLLNIVLVLASSSSSLPRGPHRVGHQQYNQERKNHETCADAVLSILQSFAMVQGVVDSQGVFTVIPDGARIDEKWY